MQQISQLVMIIFYSFQCSEKKHLLTGVKWVWNDYSSTCLRTCMEWKQHQCENYLCKYNFVAYLPFGLLCRRI